MDCTYTHIHRFPTHASGLQGLFFGILGSGWGSVNTYVKTYCWHPWHPQGCQLRWFQQVQLQFQAKDNSHSNVEDLTCPSQ